jgi:hypothetical protein
MKVAGMMVRLEELFDVDREQRAEQCGEDRQLIVGPLDGRQRRAQRLDFLAAVNGAVADE